MSQVGSFPPDGWEFDDRARLVVDETRLMSDSTIGWGGRLFSMAGPGLRIAAKTRNVGSLLREPLARGIASGLEWLSFSVTRSFHDFVLENHRIAI